MAGSTFLHYEEKPQKDLLDTKENPFRKKAAIGYDR